MPNAMTKINNNLIYFTFVIASPCKGRGNLINRTVIANPCKGRGNLMNRTVIAN